MTISGPDSTAANAAITAITAALTAYDAIPSPFDKNLYEAGTLLPLVSSSAGLALTLGRELYAELIAAAQAALQPFCLSNVERDRLTYELTVPSQLRGWVNNLAQSAECATHARDNAGLIFSIFTQVLAAVA